MLRRQKRQSRPRASWRSNGLLSLVLAIAFAGCAQLLLTPSERFLSGRATATDGDSLRIDQTRIRLIGLDAPELDQICSRGGRSYPCGEAARDALLSLILRNPVTCRSSGRDKYKRVLAKCTVAGNDLGARMVSEGWAVAYGEYAAQERDAKARRAGLWAGTFDPPRTWRRLHSPMS